MDPSGSKCNENRRGPTTESCGTPRWHGVTSVDTEGWSAGSDLNHSRAAPPPPVPTQHSKGDIRILWSAASNTAIKYKSRRMTLTRVGRKAKNSLKPDCAFPENDRKWSSQGFLKEMVVVGLKFDRIVGSRAGFLIRGLTTACLSILGKVGEYRALFRPGKTDGKTSLKSGRGTASLGDLEGFRWPTISSRTDMITGCWRGQRREMWLKLLKSKWCVFVGRTQSKQTKKQNKNNC